MTTWICYCGHCLTVSCCRFVFVRSFPPLPIQSTWGYTAAGGGENFDGIAKNVLDVAMDDWGIVARFDDGSAEIRRIPSGNPSFNPPAAGVLDGPSGTPPAPSVLDISCGGNACAARFSDGSGMFHLFMRARERERERGCYHGHLSCSFWLSALIILLRNFRYISLRSNS